MSRLTDERDAKKDIDEVKEQAVEQPVEVPKGVINLDMHEAARTKIWVNGDCTKIIELNLSDLGVSARFNDVYPKLLALQDDISAMLEDGKPEDADDNTMTLLVSQFRTVDKKMRDYVDYIFDFPVSDVCCDGGSMYDLVGGKYRFEYIIEKLSKLYDDRFTFEDKKLRDRMKSHTAKYTKGKRTPRK